MHAALVQRCEIILKQVIKASCRAHQFEPARLRLEVPLSDLGETPYKHEENHIQSPKFSEMQYYR